MKSDFNSRFIFLSERLDSFYNEDFSSDKDMYRENKKIKSDVVAFILDANSCDERTFVDKAFKLLVENTGCQEDLEILREILLPVFEKKILDDELLDKYLKDSPLSRWL
ncbi:hypothetical protein BV924_21230 [Pectobacterium odoriferum]|uniref:MafI family immunity protein n=1 Tax=Pectobacterium odoriferum TaxID=78398 RepID=A0ABD6VL93_9GAMM|nr:hypothetical protein [Pectobacterium odoriferum]POD91403.1 hypothetical protein BVY06_21580 [Pectobacterium odoriferum]POE08488.1 hypothetical protein BV924_21230 [Pectobacterium odoriferum]POE22861.1 hypothetical protein BV926_21295 [Pectobacterium odoriferum]POE27364.1 hypothetical protein BV919_20945 [Pectobacterium odoriferum]POE36783.1 hypothetical protein BV920_21355 [Pectobacterium odoriferum]